MKSYILYICSTACLLFLSVSAVSFAEEEKAYTEVVDMVYEWSPNGTRIQVGDYTISSFSTVWLDRGDGKVNKTTRNKIKTGDLVKAYLTNEDENGFWTADRLIVLSAEAFYSTVEGLPEIKKNEIMYSQEHASENIPPIPQSKRPILNNGVWEY